MSFRFVTAGESHGPGLTAIVEGLPAGLELSPEAIDRVVDEVHLPRPGHADLAGVLKFGHSDVRNVLERASARETAARVAAGALAKAYLRAMGVEVLSHVTRIGSVAAAERDDLTPEDFEGVDESPVRSLDDAASEAMVE